MTNFSLFIDKNVVFLVEVLSLREILFQLITFILYRSLLTIILAIIK